MSRGKKAAALSDRAAEAMFYAWLGANGFIVHWAKGAVGLFARVDRNGNPIRDEKGRPVYVSTDRDIFRCFDHLAIGDYVWLIQITTKAGVWARKRKIDEKEWPPGLCALIRKKVVRQSIAYHAPYTDPFDRRRISHAWQVIDRSPDGNGGYVWLEPKQVDFDKSALKGKTAARLLADRSKRDQRQLDRMNKMSDAIEGRKTC